MFLDTLSVTVHRICNARRLSYAAASRRCRISPRCFGDIARGKTAPSVSTLEKLCVGFSLTPNDLLLSPAEQKRPTFRDPMPVTQIRCFHADRPYGLTGFPVCPRCKVTLEREYQAYCDRCGQCLSWKGFSKAEILPPRE